MLAQLLRDIDECVYMERQMCTQRYMLYIGRHRVTDQYMHPSCELQMG